MSICPRDFMNVRVSNIQRTVYNKRLPLITTPSTWQATALAVLGSEEEIVAAAMPGGDVLLLAPTWTADTS